MRSTISAENVTHSNKKSLDDEVHFVNSLSFVSNGAFYVQFDVSSTQADKSEQKVLLL